MSTDKQLGQLMLVFSFLGSIALGLTSWLITNRNWDVSRKKPIDDARLRK